MLTGPFIEGKEVLNQIEQAGFQAFFVGGCVRDLLLNEDIQDIDITTSASPTDIMKIFPKVIPVGIEHGTVIVRYKQKSYEVTTFRLDGEYSDQRHPDHVQFVDQIDADLKRRDFTINAMAMNQSGELTDLFGGRKDIERRIIQTVGDGYERFKEDPLRIIRALRFSSQLGFSIDPNTLIQMKKLKKQIETIAIERILVEMEKFFAGEYLSTGMDYLKQTGIYQHLPVFLDDPTFINEIPELIQPLNKFSEVLALFHHIKPSIDIQTWIKSWKCSNRTKQATMQLVEAIHYYELNGLDELLVYNLAVENFDGFIRLMKVIDEQGLKKVQDIRKIHDELPIHSIRDLAIDGNALMALFPEQKPGPWIHETLQKLVIEVVFKRLDNEKNGLKEWITCNPPAIN